MYGGHSVLRSNSKLHVNFVKMQTSAHTSWILAASTIYTAQTQGETYWKSRRLSTCWRRDAVHALCAGEEMLILASARSAEARISIIIYIMQSVSVAFEKGKEML